MANRVAFSGPSKSPRRVGYAGAPHGSGDFRTVSYADTRDLCRFVQSAAGWPLSIFPGGGVVNASSCAAGW